MLHPKGTVAVHESQLSLWGRATVQGNKEQEFCLAKKSFGLDGSTSNDPLISRGKIHPHDLLLFGKEEPGEERDNWECLGVQGGRRWSLKHESLWDCPAETLP